MHAGDYFTVNRIFKDEGTYTVKQPIFLFGKVYTKITVRLWRIALLTREKERYYQQQTNFKRYKFQIESETLNPETFNLKP